MKKSTAGQSNLALVSALGVQFITHHHTIPHFYILEIYSTGKHCEKRRNFLKMFSTLYGTFFSILNAL